MKDRKKIVFIIMFVVLVVIYICDHISFRDKNKGPEEATQDVEEREINIIVPSHMENKEIIELEVPKIALDDIRGETDEEIAIGFKETFEEQNIYMQDIYVNDAGKIIMVLDREQLEQYINFRQRKLQQALDNDIPWDTSNVSIEINEDFTCVNYYVTEDCDLFEHSIMRMWIEPTMAVAQTILGVPSDKWQVKHTVYFKNDEVVMLEFYSGANQDGEITGKEWEQKMEEAKKLVEEHE